MSYLDKFGTDEFTYCEYLEVFYGVHSGYVAKLKHSVNTLLLRHHFAIIRLLAK